MMDDLKTVDIYIGTSIRGPSRGNGKVCYVMQTKKRNGSDYESSPVMAAYDDATEARLTLYALRDALQRLNYACRVVLHTEDTYNYVPESINSHRMENWQQNSWKNSKGKPVDPLWKDIYEELSENGHNLIAVTGKHEYSEWMRWNLELDTQNLSLPLQCQGKVDF